MALVVGGAIGTERQLAAERGALAVAEERVVVRHRREPALGQAAHPQPVEVDAEGHAHRPDEHAVAQAADPIARGVELELERAPEHLDRRPGIDRVEGAEPVEHRFDPTGRDLFERRPTRAP